MRASLLEPSERGAYPDEDHVIANKKNEQCNAPIR
jgi:hypothetical protein